MRHFILLIGFSSGIISSLLGQCENSPDIVILNAHIITMNTGQPIAHAVAIKNGNIQAIGELAEIIYTIAEDCPVQWIDAGGKTILPGFNDSHCHWLSWHEHICDAPGHEQTTYPELKVIMDTLSMEGWTSISELNFGRPALIPEHLQNAMALEANGDLNVRLNGYWGTYDNIDLIAELQNYGYEPMHVFSDRIRAPGVKMYVDDPFGTMDIMDQATCTQLVSTAHAAGYQVAAHCVNQTAVEKILTAYESALGSGNNDNARHRIEHAVKVSDNQLQRIKNKGILLSFQLMGPPDWPEQNTFQTYLSNTNTNYLLRWKDFLDNNIPSVGSTDAPFNNTVCDYSPFRVIYQGVTRIGYLNRIHAQWELDQRISIAEGLKLLTLDGAWATKEESVKGSLEIGKYADLIIVTEDPLAVQAPEDLLDIHTLLTMVGGEIEYCKEDIPEFCQPPIAFRVDSMIVSVNNYLEDQKPGRAFDLDEETGWISGKYPPQYIQIDLLKNTLLDRIELVVDQFPAGFTQHQILGAQENQGLQVLHDFSGITEPLQTLVYNFDEANRSFRFIRISTLQSPSWVAWREIRIIKEGISAIEGNQNNSVSTAILFPNPFTNEFIIDLQLNDAIHDADISIVTLDGKTIYHQFAEYLSAGKNQIKVNAEFFNQVGMGNLMVIIKSGPIIIISRVTKL